MYAISDLLMRLLACPSLSPRDAGCMELIAAELLPFDFFCQRMDIADTANFFASFGHGRPHICFVGHTDVVPASGQDWISPPFVPYERDGKIFARGAADMKSALAAMVVALQELAQTRNLQGTVSLLLTSDAKSLATNGICAVMPRLQAENIFIDYGIIGEPTARKDLGDCARKGRRGSLNLEISIEGQEGHIAYPEHLRNPIAVLAKICAELSAVVWDQGMENFPATTCQISNFHAGDGAENTVPRRANAKLNWRFNPLHSPEQIREFSEKIIEKNCRESEVHADCNWRLSAEIYLNTDEIIVNALTQAVEDNLGRRVIFDTAGGSSDGRFLEAYGAKVLEFGVCNASIHRANEWVRIADLEPLARIYRDSAKNIIRAWHNLV